MDSCRVLGIAALACITSACGISIENTAPLEPPWSASGLYTLSARVEAAGSDIVAVRAEVDSTVVPLALAGDNIWTGTYAGMRCTRGFSVRYAADYRTSSGPTQTIYEPPAGRFMFWVRDVPEDCPVGLLPRELVVDDLGDAIDVAPGDGRCATELGRCTLRAAIMESNAVAGPNLVRLPRGIITLSLTTGPNRHAISITDNVTIRGVEGPGAANNLSVITVDPAAGNAAATAGFGFGIFSLAATPALSAHVVGVTMRQGFGLYGGVIRNGAALLLERVVIEDAAIAALGGGILNDTSGAVTLVQSTVRNNVAGSGGGLYSSGSVILRGSTLSGNRAQEGGGMFTYVGHVEIADSTLSGNTASKGGGMRVLYPATVSVRNSTISGNFARAAGGGVDTEGPPVRFQIGHSILAGNGAGGAGTADAKAPLQSLGYNVIGVCGAAADPCTRSGFGVSSDQVGTALLPLDPLLLPLAANGGPTLTHMPHASSPVSERGNAASASDADPSKCTRRDQRGVARPVGMRCDVGALEN